MKALKVIGLTIVFVLASLFIVPMMSGMGFGKMEGDIFVELADPWYLVIAKIVFYIAWFAILPVGILAVVRGLPVFRRILLQLACAVVAAFNALISAWAFDMSSRSLIINIIAAIVGVASFYGAIKMAVTFTIGNLCANDPRSENRSEEG